MRDFLLLFCMCITVCLCNYVRGRGFLKWQGANGVPEGSNANRVIFCAFTACAAQIEFMLIGGMPHAQAFYTAIIIAAGLAIWVWPGWGKYFCAFTGLDDNQTEIRWIDYLGYKLIPRTPSQSPLRNRMRGVIFMALRSLYALPMFSALVVFCGFSLAPIPLIYLMGLCYYAGSIGNNYIKYGTTIPEALTGALLGFLLAWSYIAGTNHI